MNTFQIMILKQISTFHKMKTRTKTRHGSLHLYPINTCLKFESFIWNIE